MTPDRVAQGPYAGLTEFDDVGRRLELAEAAGRQAAAMALARRRIADHARDTWVQRRARADIIDALKRL